MATDWTALRKFYVYDLIDPRDLRTFYVGKGQGDIMREAEETANEIISRAEREIRRQQSPELVAFGRDWLETGKSLLAKIVAMRYPDGCLSCH